MRIGILDKILAPEQIQQALKAFAFNACGFVQCALNTAHGHQRQDPGQGGLLEFLHAGDLKALPRQQVDLLLVKIVNDDRPFLIQAILVVEALAVMGVVGVSGSVGTVSPPA